MLNLSDKELDRLSKEAAQEYDPGDILGANSWEKLQVSLDRELGPSTPNPLRHIRRFPFYYAPALLLVVGLSYYLSRHAGAGTRGTASGGPPGRAAQATAGSTSTLSASTTTAATPSEKDKGGAARVVMGGSGSRTAEDGRAPKSEGRERSDGGGASGPTGGSNDANATATEVSRRQEGTHQVGSAADLSNNPARLGARRNGRETKTDERSISGNDRTSGRGQRAMTGIGQGTGNRQGRTTGSAQVVSAGGGQGTTTGAGAASGAKQEQELTYSRTPGLQSTKKTPVIGDSALRAFTLKSSVPYPIRMRALYIKRTLQFGFLAAPDYTSVNSLAGDKAGSTLGLTLDYEFASRWYLSSGLQLSRKNYSASSSDFNAPTHWYSNNYINRNSLDFVKGSFEMLEIPLDLRYDFSVAGSTLFFASVGLSSYLLTSESCNYYVNNGFGDIGKHWNNPAQQSYLFSAANLSLGVETGISNSLSILIAPYAKLPVRNVGIGQVQLNSVGIDFVLKYSPITSRKRR
jgi:hypothetical protein